MRPKTDGILESSLYVSDVSRSIRFHQDIFGFSVISDFGERGCAMQAGTHQVLLLFKKGASRTIPSPHDGDGELHLAFETPDGGFIDFIHVQQLDGGRTPQHRVLAFVNDSHRAGAELLFQRVLAKLLGLDFRLLGFASQSRRND